MKKIWTIGIIAVIILTIGILATSVMADNNEIVTTSEKQEVKIIKDTDFRVRLLRENKILIGNEEGKLMLEETLKRQEMVVLISRLMGVEETAKAWDASKLSFTDVAKGDWAAPYIAWAKDNNITKGYDESTFGYDDSLTGLQTEIFLLRVLGYSEVTMEDAEKIALENGVGYGISLSDINKAITRSDVSIMLYNTLYGYIKDTEGTLIEKLKLVDEMTEEGRGLAITLAEFDVDYLSNIDKENNYEFIYVDTKGSTLGKKNEEEYKLLARSLVGILGFKNMKIMDKDNGLEIVIYCQDSTNEILAIEVDGVYNYFNMTQAF